MNILQICPVSFLIYKASGTASVAYAVSSALSVKGHRIWLITTQRHGNNGLQKSTKIGDNFSVYTCGLVPKSLNRFDLTTIPYADSEVLQRLIERADVIHLHDYRSSLNVHVVRYAQRYNVPYVVQAHGSLPRMADNKKLKLIYDVFFGYRILQNASKVIAVGNTEVGQYKAMGVPEENIAVVPNGIELAEYDSLPPRGSFKRKFNIDEDTKIILYLARINEIKGVDVLIRSYGKMVNDMKDKNALLVIAGPDDGYMGAATSLVNQLKIRDRVIFTGPLYGRNKLEAYVDADAYVLPSRYEIWGLTVLEAYACGRPVIASNVEGLKDLVIDGVTGKLVNSGNEGQLARTILALLNDRDKATEMGLKGREFVSENFSMEKVIKRLEGLYSEAVSKRPNA